MNRDDVIRMAREAWGEGAVYRFDSPKHWPEVEEMFVRFAALVAAAEREACAAQVGQQWTTFEELKAAHYRHSPEPFDPFRFHKDLSTIFFSRDMAYAIRARGQG